MTLLSRAHGRAVFGRRVRVIVDHMADLLPDRARVLDVGCGDGSVAVALMVRRPDIDVHGIDVLVRPETQIPVVEFDGISIPHGDNSFDAVTFVDVLHHTDDPTVLLAEASRVASRAVVVKDHLLEGVLAGPTLRLMDWVGNAGHGVRLPYNYWPRHRWSGAFVAAGLRVDREETALGLYPAPATWVFDRHLHVVWRLTPDED